MEISNCEIVQNPEKEIIPSEIEIKSNNFNEVMNNDAVNPFIPNPVDEIFQRSHLEIVKKSVEGILF